MKIWIILAASVLYCFLTYWLATLGEPRALWMMKMLGVME